MTAKMLELEKFAHIIHYAVCTHLYRLWIYRDGPFFVAQTKMQICPWHWYWLFILRASNKKTQNLTVLGDDL